jgi:hypothetical protein
MMILAIRVVVMSVSSQSVHVVGEHHALSASCNTMQVSNTILSLDGRRAPKQAAVSAC